MAIQYPTGRLGPVQQKEVGHEPSINSGRRFWWTIGGPCAAFDAGGSRRGRVGGTAGDLRDGATQVLGAGGKRRPRRRGTPAGCPDRTGDRSCDRGDHRDRAGGEGGGGRRAEAGGGSPDRRPGGSARRREGSWGSR